MRTLKKENNELDATQFETLGMEIMNRHGGGSYNTRYIIFWSVFGVNYNIVSILWNHLDPYTTLGKK